MDKGKNQLILVVTVFSVLVDLTCGQTTLLPENQVVDSALLEPFPNVIYKVRHYQGQRWKNVLIPPGRDPYVKPLETKIPLEIGEKTLPEVLPYVPPDDVERKKRGLKSLLMNQN
ncbi:hypothetical protein GE061_008112 [Apolygus lucorum]|uniref:Uncharacterized protein n=1 Tax=Apolygus lucorum TaxID=248454 RepID=A0A8S9WQ71_APOLU|nr:hypothetical protein GE061_008112 [Apolygus lucorum]